MRRILYSYSVADNKRNELRSSCKVPYISAVLQLHLDYLEVFSFKSSVQNSHRNLSNENRTDRGRQTDGQT